MAEVAALLLNWQQPELTAQCLRDLVAAVPSGLAVVVCVLAAPPGFSAPRSWVRRSLGFAPPWV